MKRAAKLFIILLLAAPGVQADGDPYGQLFTTPAERARLDHRFSAAADSTDSAQAGASVADTRAPRRLKVNGTVISSTGKKEVWINGESQLNPGQGSGGHVRLLDADHVRVQPTATGPSRDMKPGQVLDPNTGTVSEAYEQAVTPAIPADDAS